MIVLSNSTPKGAKAQFLLRKKAGNRRLISLAFIKAASAASIMPATQRPA
jgi:hypothetical protein